MTKFNLEYGVPYKELVYSIWYTNNRPSMATLHDLIPDDELIHTRPTPTTLSVWKKDLAWDARADNTDFEVTKQTDRQLIEIRLEMMQRHADQAKKIAKEAFDFLTDTELGGFDSSASAVNAWAKAVEEEKKSTGLSIALTEILSLSDDDLKRKLNNLLSRMTNVGEVTSNDDEVVDAISTEETPNE